MYENLNENGRGKKNFKFNFILRKKEMSWKMQKFYLRFGSSIQSKQEIVMWYVHIISNSTSPTSLELHPLRFQQNSAQTIIMLLMHCKEVEEENIMLHGNI
jgi:hypothetical protein